jgi:hypothetical protein
MNATTSPEARRALRLCMGRISDEYLFCAEFLVPTFYVGMRF